MEECIFRALGNREITVENVAKLKQKVDLLPADLRETVIGRSCCCYREFSMLFSHSSLLTGGP